MITPISHLFMLMLPIITEKSADIAEICRRHGVRQLGVFDPETAGTSIGTFAGTDHGEVGVVIEFEQDSRGLAQIGRLMKLEEALGKLLQHRVGLAQRRAIEQSENPNRRKAILSNLESVYG